jgi:hypothetical protein
MTLVGCFVSAVLIVAGKRPAPNQYGWYFEIGEGWGGLELGPMCIVNKNPTQHILDHEFGHSIQNCLFGPFMILISLASAIRYWDREIQKVQGKQLVPYDAIWFEGQATKWGETYRKRVQ